MCCRREPAEGHDNEEMIARHAAVLRVADDKDGYASHHLLIAQDEHEALKSSAPTILDRLRWLILESEKAFATPYDVAVKVVQEAIRSFVPNSVKEITRYDREKREQ